MRDKIFFKFFRPIDDNICACIQQGIGDFREFAVFAAISYDFTTRTDTRHDAGHGVINKNTLPGINTHFPCSETNDIRMRLGMLDLPGA